MHLHCCEVNFGCFYFLYLWFKNHLWFKLDNYSWYYVFFTFWSVVMVSYKFGNFFYAVSCTYVCRNDVFSFRNFLFVFIKVHSLCLSIHNFNYKSLRFYWLYLNSFAVQTDHKPFLFIFLNWVVNWLKK